MKKIIFLFVLLCSITSCKKKETAPTTPAQVCVTCSDYNTGYKPFSDYCGTATQADNWIEQVKAEWERLGGTLVCKKH